LNFLLQLARCNELPWLLVVVGRDAKTAGDLMQVSVEHYFPDKDIVPFKMHHDACLRMEEIAMSLDKSAQTFQEVFDGH
jgi:hypothetical protein